MNNKVKFNICNCHYALQRAAEDGEMTFDTPVAMPGAVSLALDPNGESESFYADGIDGKEVLFMASAAIPRIYRLKIQRDI